MTYRLFVMFLTAGLVALALPTVADAQGSVPRTSWGDPDLSGAWTNATMTPLQRPVELGDKEFLTAEEGELVRPTGVERFGSRGRDARRPTQIRTQARPACIRLVMSRVFSWIHAYENPLP